MPTSALPWPALRVKTPSANTPSSNPKTNPAIVRATSATIDPVADTQRVTGMVLSYLAKMGISASLVEAMSRTSDISWLSIPQAVTMNLITDPLRRP